MSHSSASVTVVGGFFPHMWHIQRKRIRDCLAWRRSSDSISLIESALRLSSTGCLGDSLLRAGRGAASSPAYMKPLEVNFLIKSPQPPQLHPHLPLYWMDACDLIFVCVQCTCWGCVYESLIYNANVNVFFFFFYIRHMRVHSEPASVLLSEKVSEMGVAPCGSHWDLTQQWTWKVQPAGSG